MNGLNINNDVNYITLLNKIPPKRDGKTYDIVSWRWFAFQARWQYLGRHCLFIFDSFRKNEAKPCIKKAWQFLFIGITFYAFSPLMLALPFNQSYLPSKKDALPLKWNHSCLALSMATPSFFNDHCPCVRMALPSAWMSKTLAADSQCLFCCHCNKRLCLFL